MEGEARGRRREGRGEGERAESVQTREAVLHGCVRTHRMLLVDAGHRAGGVNGESAVLIL